MVVEELLCFSMLVQGLIHLAETLEMYCFCAGLCASDDLVPLFLSPTLFVGYFALISSGSALPGLLVCLYSMLRAGFASWVDGRNCIYLLYCIDKIPHFGTWPDGLMFV